MTDRAFRKQSRSNSGPAQHGLATRQEDVGHARRTAEIFRPEEVNRRSGPITDILALQRAAGNGAVSRQLRSRSQSNANGLPPIVQSVLNSDSGQPLDTATRALMESRFGQDFGHVRIHTDARAAESAREVNARAYTVGHEIVLGAGQYEASSKAGQRLLAHELAHVVQQERGGASLPSPLPGGPLEHAADRAAAAFAQGNGRIEVAGTSQTGLARQPLPYSLTYDVNPKDLDFKERQREVGLLRDWLDKHRSPTDERARALKALEAFEAFEHRQNDAARAAEAAEAERIRIERERFKAEYEQSQKVPYWSFFMPKGSSGVFIRQAPGDIRNPLLRAQAETTRRGAVAGATLGREVTGIAFGAAGLLTLAGTAIAGLAVEGVLTAAGRGVWVYAIEKPLAVEAITEFTGSLVINILEAGAANFLAALQTAEGMAAFMASVFMLRVSIGSGGGSRRTVEVPGRPQSVQGKKVKVQFGGAPRAAGPKPAKTPKPAPGPAAAKPAPGPAPEKPTPPPPKPAPSKQGAPAKAPGSDEPIPIERGRQIAKRREAAQQAEAQRKAQSEHQPERIGKTGTDDPVGIAQQPSLRGSGSGTGGGPTVRRFPPGPKPPAEPIAVKGRPLPEGTHKETGTLKPRTASRTDPEVLRANMEAVGKRVPDGHDAHHIVLKKGGGWWGAQARRALGKVGIKINDPANGIALPGSNRERGTVAEPEGGPWHGTMHTEPYYKEVANRLKGVKSQSEARAILRQIEDEIRFGSFPH